MVGKWLELRKEIAPSIRRIAVIQNPDDPSSAGYLREVETAAPSFGVRLNPAGVRDAAQIVSIIGLFRRAAPYVARILAGKDRESTSAGADKV